MVSTYGLPLDTVIYLIKEKGFVPGWCEFYEDCVKGGWNPKSLMVKLETVVKDIYGPEYYEEWKTRMDFYVEEYGGREW